MSQDDYAGDDEPSSARVWLIILAAFVALIGGVCVLIEAAPARTLANLPAWVPHLGRTVGLKDAGGVYAVLKVDENALNANSQTDLVGQVRSTLRSQGISFIDLHGDNGAAVVRIDDPHQIAAATQVLGQLQTEDVGVVRLPFAVSNLPDQSLRIGIDERAEVYGAARRSVDIVRRRLIAIGVRDPRVSLGADGRITIEAPGYRDLTRLAAIVGQTSRLTFQMVDDAITPDQIEDGLIPVDDELLDQQDQGRLAVKRRAGVSGDLLTDARASFDQNGRPAIAFRFNAEGAKRFGDLTTQGVGKRFAIVIDRHVLSAPTVIEPILGGAGEITGSFTAESANNLALMLRSGALPAPLIVVEQRLVEPAA